MLLKALIVDNYAYIAIAFLVITVLITLGLGAWVMAHLSSKKKSV
jgi:hypothetical protein